MLTIRHIEHSRNKIHPMASHETGHSDNRLQYLGHGEVAVVRQIIPRKPQNVFQAARDVL